MRTASALLSALALTPVVGACEKSVSSDPHPAASNAPPALSGPPPTGAPAMQPTANHLGALPQEATFGSLQTVATFERMPAGVAVSRDGRIFVSFPRWADNPIDTSVAEVKDGQPTPYPDAQWNPAQPGNPATTFVGVQSVVMDPKNRLWVLDTGTVNMGAVEPGGAKLVGFDLASNKPFATIPFPANVAQPTSYLNDVRFDVHRGKAGFAYISDSSSSGPNAIVVVDLDAKKGWRRLSDHPSVKPEPGFLAIVEGQPLYKQQAAGQPRTPFVAGVDGIEVSPDGKTVFYSALGGRHLYSVSADALSDPNVPDSQVAATVKDLGEKGASDGLVMSSGGRLYVTDYENNAILRRNPDGTWETVASDSRMLWPDSMSLGSDGFLYFTVNQLERQPSFHDGQDTRQKPYAILRARAGDAPMRATR
jgi:sugar lactone lactonase YvrE